MGEVIRHSFGDRINWENDNDPVVRETKFLTHSPSVNHNTLLRAAQKFNWTREQVRDQLREIHIDLAEKAGIPGSSADIHRKWMESLEYYDPYTFEFREATPAETDAVVRPITQDIREQASEALDPPPKADVVPFPSMGSSVGSGNSVPPSCPPA